MVRRQEVLKLVGEGLSVVEIGQRLGRSRDTVTRVLHQALSQDTLFPSTLSSEKVGTLRQIEAEKLQTMNRKLQSGVNMAFKIMMEEQSPELKLAAVSTMSRTIEVSGRLSAQFALLYGLNTPQKVVTEQLNINLERREEKITISFDASVLKEPSQAVNGLQIFEGTESITDVEGSFSTGVVDPEAPAMATTLLGEGEEA
jgi:IS30 family transposase